ncbi:DUF1493 family protein [Pseudomonas putida]|uniref:DUF1493 family protein n=1 Tax=Pseudomonas putida TaxID=303 RepID=UPI002236B7A5
MRKMRVAAKGQGKRGGARVIYYHFISASQIALLMIYPKNEQQDLTADTSINIDLGCNGADAQHLIETLEDHFAIDFVDYDSYRYFQPDGYDVFLKRKAKGRGDKVPLTIGMLYRAIKAQRWDTDELEGL